MADLKTKLCQGIINFIKDELSDSSYSTDAIESLEVAKQCLETAFNVSSDFNVDQENLIILFKRGLETSCNSKNLSKQPSEEEKILAENLKMQGNTCVAEGKFNEAIACYSKAIKLTPDNAVYYCNRAAAYGRLNKNAEAIKDCEEAIIIDPTYSKAYGRMGLAYSAQGNIQNAIDCYKKAINLDPTNQNFQQNLVIAERQLTERPNIDPAAFTNNLAGLFSNPAVQNFAQQFISNPQLVSNISTLMQSTLTTPNTNTSSDQNSDESPATTGPNLDDLLRIGQQLAQQMQQSNPELVDDLRRMAQQNTPGAGRLPDQDQNNGV